MTSRLATATPPPQSQPVAWAQRTGDEWALGYWASILQRHRALLVKAVDRLAPFDSVVELGCAAAPNLRLIQAKYPGTRCHGIDINPTMILTAFEQACLEGWEPQLDLEHDDIRTCRVPPGDVIFSVYTLAYVEPRLIGDVLDRMLASAARGLVLFEPMEPGRNYSRLLTDPLVHRLNEWSHPYAHYIAHHYKGWVLEGWPLEPPEDRLNRCLLVRRETPFSFDPSRPLKGAS